MAVPPGTVTVGRAVGDGFAGQVCRAAAPACGAWLLRHRRARVAPATGTGSFAGEGAAAGIGRVALLRLLAEGGVLHAGRPAPPWPAHPDARGHGSGPPREGSGRRGG